MSDMVKIKVYVNTGYPSAKHEDIYEVDKVWWESLSKRDQEEELEEMAVEFRNNCIDCGAWVMEDDE